MKKAMLVFLSVVLAAALSVPFQAAAKEPVKIGVLVPLTGIVAQGGLEMKYGIEMAAAEKGTVLGRPIELLVEDTQV
ncbi:MAG: ABC transporter substrate-binding protein, partial [Desulfobacterales bacterium]